MKKLSLYASLTLMCLGVLASCSSDPEFDSTLQLISGNDLKYDADGIWNQNNTDGMIETEGFEFSHNVDADGYVYGFTPSISTDTSRHNPLYTFPYASAAGANVAGKYSHYFVGYWPEWLEGTNPSFDDHACRFYSEEGVPFKPQSISICNNTYLMYAGLDGSDFSPKFKPGDWVTLIIHGVHLDGTESVISPYLINIEDTDVKAGILMTWEQVDLRELGECTGVYFTMDACDDLKSSYGLDIPTYFCISDLIVNI